MSFGMNMAIALMAIVLVWASLIGTAWMCRRWDIARSRSMVAVACCYAGVNAVALLWLGWTWHGLFGVVGMTLPFAFAMVLVVAKPGPVSGR